MNHREKFELMQCNGLKFARPGSKPSYAPDQDFKTEHIFLDLQLDIPRETVRGVCTATLRAINGGTRKARFDAVDMKEISVFLSSGEKLAFSYDGKTIIVRLPGPVGEGERVTLKIVYLLSKPLCGVYFIKPDRNYPDKPVQVWTHGEAEEARYWFPCFDAPHDKATTEMIATVPRDFFALSNGALIGIQENKAKRTKSYHWKQAIPHSPYLVTLAAGKFSEISDEWDGIPVLYYCAQGREKDAARAFGKTPKMLKFFSESIGYRYPYEKYAQVAVADFIMGGMEHTSATTQTDRVLMDERAYPEFTADWLVSHELAHQWFGDLLTCKEWSHAWLNESFATYFEALFVEHDLGKDEFEYEMRDKAKLYLEEGKDLYKRAIVTNVYRKPEDLFDRHLYEKGSLVLHMLRRQLGDELFWKAINFYVKNYQGMAVETSDLINSIQESTGRNFRKFFDQWVFSPGHPDLTAHYWWDDKKKNASVRILQRADGKSGLFSLPLEIEFITSSGRKIFKQAVDGKKHQFLYRFGSEPLDVRIDPGYSLLKTIRIVKPYKMWLKQLQSDPHPVGRAEAAQEISKLRREDSLQSLAGAFRKEKFWGTAKEIALAIGSLKTEEARQFLIRALKIKNPKMRRGVAEALGQFQDRDTVSKLGSLAGRDPSYFVASECLRSLARSRSAEAVRFIKKGLRTKSWNDVVRSSAVSVLSQIPSEDSIHLLREYCRVGAHPSTRVSALQAMSRCSQSFPALFPEILCLLSDPQVRIRHAAISSLGNLQDPRAVPELEKISKDKKIPYRTRALAEDALLKINPDADETKS